MKRAITPILFLFPAVSLVMIFIVYPIFYSFYLSLHSWDMISPNRIFVGFKNYAKLIRDRMFINALKNTLIFTIYTVPTQIILALGLAILLNQKLKGISIYRAIFFSPVVTSIVAISAVWMWIYHPSLGLINYFFRILGINPVNWLGDPKTALLSVSIMSIWRGLGRTVVIFLAGLQEIPKEMQESAQIEGASNWQIFKYITWKLLSPTTFFILVVSTINAMQVFTQIHVMTQGGPAGATEVIVYNLYYRGFQLFQMGYASAIAYVLFAFIISLTLMQKYMLNRWVFY
ncbi:MAG: sugar ABC transporter permease [bacterium]|nr:sugar ABC transporter permease [bacterium]